MLERFRCIEQTKGDRGIRLLIGLREMKFFGDVTFKICFYSFTLPSFKLSSYNILLWKSYGGNLAWQKRETNSIIVKSSYIEPDFSMIEFRVEADFYIIEY